MSGGEIVGLVLLAAVIAAFFLARRKGRQAWTAAIATAKAEGRAELQAELDARATAVAHGGSVALHIGHGGSVTTGGDDDYLHGTDDDFDQHIAALYERRRVAQLRGVRTMHPAGLDRLEERMGGVLDGVQPRQDAPDRHGWALPVADPGHGDLPGRRDAEVTGP